MDSEANSTQGFLSRQMSQIQISKIDLVKQFLIENKIKILGFLTILNFLMNIILIAKINNMDKNNGQEIVPIKSSDVQDTPKIIDVQNQIKENNKITKNLDILMANKMESLKPPSGFHNFQQWQYNNYIKGFGNALLSYFFQKIMEDINGNYFYKHPNKMDYDSAITTCSEINAHLMDFGDDFEANLKKMKAVKTFYHMEDVTNIWIGLDDKTKENHWIWKHSNKTLPTNSSLWAPGEPDSLHSSHDCVEVHIKDDTIELYDVSCNRDLTVICEKCNKNDFHC